MDMQKKIEDRFGRIMLSPCQLPRDINGAAGRILRILWIGARAAGAEFGTGAGIGIRMSAGYSIEYGSKPRRTVRTGASAANIRAIRG